MAGGTKPFFLIDEEMRKLNRVILGDSKQGCTGAPCPYWTTLLSDGGRTRTIHTEVIAEFSLSAL